ncbi:MAG: zinc-ribbon domain-containing protein [Candidatus Theseobacter exili]|nr:zinc-ribbon domain-containing protein [Candidatus Theseobacter exili]
MFLKDFLSRIFGKKKSIIYSKNDETIICKDCGNNFIFTEGEKDFFKSKGFSNKPTRCKSCRSKRKSRHSSRNSRFRKKGTQNNSRKS